MHIMIVLNWVRAGTLQLNQLFSDYNQKYLEDGEPIDGIADPKLLYFCELLLFLIAVLVQQSFGESNI